MPTGREGKVCWKEGTMNNHCPLVVDGADGGGGGSSYLSPQVSPQLRNFTRTSYPAVHRSLQPGKFTEGSIFIRRGPVYTNTLVTDLRWEETIFLSPTRDGPAGQPSVILEQAENREPPTSPTSCPVSLCPSRSSPWGGGPEHKGPWPLSEALNC